ncbi:hypothetical protein EDD11_008979 [Mortierella claussenii]|nr:hypothetical protein EDD11_008979 [Mortierella claussenii]
MASDNITKVIKELELYWEELELNYFDHFMELTKFFTIYSEQLPRPELSYILVLILCCYYTATDKYLQSGLPLTRLDDKYLNLLANLGAVEKQEEIFETSNKYIEAVDVSEKLRLVLRSTLHGNYLLYVYTHSKRYFGMTEPNQ